jgi:hypothetical protein
MAAFSHDKRSIEMRHGYKNKHLMNIIGEVKMKPPAHDFRKNMSYSIDYSLMPRQKEVMYGGGPGLSHNQSMDYKDLDYELPKKKKHNMKDPAHVMGCHLCLRK